MSQEQPSGEKPAAKPEPAKPAAPPKKGWSNPALRAMGIPKISLPSRNWMIFWTVLASIGGGIYYDKHEQTKIRERYMLAVEHLGQEKYTTDRLPRKLSIFVAPPPDDFLDESLRHFRRYIKPILNSAAIDYEVYTENRQGDIRSQVAEKIRQLRRERLEQQKKQAADAALQAYERSWTRFFRETLPNKLKWADSGDEPEKYVSRHDLYDAADVLGLYQVVQPVQVKRDSAEDALKCGGVVCIGRGAYKEYMTGVHEGLLGPLEAPAPEPVVVSEEQAGDEKKAPEIDDFGGEEGAKKEENPVPKPYITPSEYSAAPLAAELDFSQVIRNNKDVPVIFEQPLYVFPIPKLRGFLNMPRKIYQYFTRREVAKEVSEQALRIVEGHSRAFEPKDSLLAKEEELTWPKKWVERGRAKNSEWVQELAVDERVTRRMQVYDKEK